MLENSTILCTLVCLLISTTIQHGVWPSAWGEALLTLLPKGKGDPTLPVSYRPISLLPILGKIAERIIFKRLRDAPDIIAASPPEQGAYQKGRGAVESVAVLLRTIESNLNTMRTKAKTGAGKKKAIAHNLGVYVAVLDLSKAFDTVPHGKALLKSLYRGAPLRFLRAWLSGRKTRVMLNGRVSESFDVGRGVPQGAVGSPPTFADFLSDIAEICRSYGVQVVANRQVVGASLFADDLALIAQDFEHLEAAFEAVTKWFKGVGMELNAAKCHTLLFPVNEKAKIPTKKSLTLNGISLPWATVTNYLGVSINVKRFTQLVRMGETDTEKVPQAVRSSWNGISRLMTEGVFTIKHALDFYRAAVLGKLLYGSELRVNVIVPSSWVKFHNTCMRQLLRAYKGDHGSSVRGEAGVPMLKEYVANRTASFVMRALTSAHEIICETVRNAIVSRDRSALGKAWYTACVNCSAEAALEGLLTDARLARESLDTRLRRKAQVYGGWKWTPPVTGDPLRELVARRKSYTTALKEAYESRVRSTWYDAERAHNPESGIVADAGTGKRKEDWSRDAHLLYDVVRDPDIRQLIFRIRVRLLGPPRMQGETIEACLLCGKANGDTVEHLFVECNGCEDASVRPLRQQFTKDELLLTQLAVKTLMTPENIPRLRLLLQAHMSIWKQRKGVVATMLSKKRLAEKKK